MKPRSTFKNDALRLFSDTDQEYQLAESKLLVQYHQFLQLLSKILDPYLICSDKTNAFIDTLLVMANIHTQPGDRYFANNSWSPDSLNITINDISQQSADHFKEFLRQNIDQNADMLAFHENTRFSYCVTIANVMKFLPLFESYFKEKLPSESIKHYQLLSQEDERINGLLLRDSLINLKKTIPAFNLSIFYVREHYLKRKLLPYLDKSIDILNRSLNEKINELADLLDKLNDDPLLKQLPAAQYTYLELVKYFKLSLMPTQQKANVTEEECTERATFSPF